MARQPVSLQPHTGSHALRQVSDPGREMKGSQPLNVWLSMVPTFDIELNLQHKWGSSRFPGAGLCLPFSYQLCNPSSSHSTCISWSGASRHCSRGHGHSREPELPPSRASLLAWTEQSVPPGVRTKVCEDVTYKQLNPNSF